MCGKSEKQCGMQTDDLMHFMQTLMSDKNIEKMSLTIDSGFEINQPNVLFWKADQLNALGVLVDCHFLYTCWRARKVHFSIESDQQFPIYGALLFRCHLATISWTTANKERRKRSLNFLNSLLCFPHPWLYAFVQLCPMTYIPMHILRRAIVLLNRIKPYCVASRFFPINHDKFKISLMMN